MYAIFRYYLLKIFKNTLFSTILNLNIYKILAKNVAIVLNFVFVYS